MKAFILAAGLGKRLRPLTEKVAKPSLPILGVSTLWFAAHQVKKQLKIEKFLINASHCVETVRKSIADADLIKHTGIHFDVSDESSELLGTSGALKKARDWIGNETLVVCNGDVISNFDLKKMLEFHIRKSSKLTIHTRSFSNAEEKYANISYDQDGRVKSFGDKTNNGIMFSGTYIIDPALIDRLPLGFSDLRPALLEPLVSEKQLFAYSEDCEWFDTGSVQAYVRTNFELLSRIPSFRGLVEVKMKEAFNDVWVPRGWSQSLADESFKRPVILNGSQKEWDISKNTFGPYFLGLNAPKNRNFPHQNALVSLEGVSKL